MGSSYLTNPVVFLVQTLFGLYILAILLRFLLQIVKADFYNPISQFLVKVTNPPLKLLRRVIPGFGGIDLSSLILAWVLKTAELFIVILIAGQSASLLGPLLLAIPELIELTINIFLFAVLIQVILSWVSPGNYNPAVSLLYSLTGPVMRPAQKLLPPVGGLDLSPMLVMIGLVLLKMLLIPPLQQLTTSLIQ
ncbi:MAG: YggT family protein [Candidatus Thiodiazotropha lotti]|uniref:YggT family protein n=1 Tax=Candidatus Thiodiazotropha endoloripes TaxID=1818881 RepID=A0A1E2ULA5_9GAMM|nr:YggT family protein [Candidatus Thiodiazotropha endoloripes]MCG7899373.1 YggT family protein [Candidatus Thiodiazotropha weberae]MCG7987395.1 YggT family protein [Candidatus Thiodiazotropha lotti]MCG7904449.1 YggT family protein [Candidatus Thiodiazotropha weberae]MCG7915897.1 YggT family protein [Candidatus Thiodiazotropha weberae]MCG7992061.1 YggT family protein [Candidatus Thiodiazotropha lotti]